MAAIKTFGVAGGGQMGAGIAQVAAQSGFDVVLYDLNAAQLEKAKAGMAKSFAKFVEKGKLDQVAADAAIARVKTTTEVADLAPCDLVVEAIVEALEPKLALFKAVGAVVRPDCVLASNTSSLPITQLAAAVPGPERFLGMHFMNPVPLMQLVEIIRGLATSDEAYQAVFDAAKAMNKTPVTVHDAAGFVSNRILMPMINEAFFTLAEGVATAEDIDTVMKLGMNHPMGPLTLADFIGLDTCLAIMEVLQAELGDDKYRPAPLLRKYVRAGWLGKKSSKGIFEYA